MSLLSGSYFCVIDIRKKISAATASGSGNTLGVIAFGDLNSA